MLNNLVDFGDDIEVFKELNVKLKKDSLDKDKQIQDLTFKIGALRNELKDSVTQVEDYRLSEKKYEKKIKEKDKDIYDIKKDLVKATEDHVADSKEISELKCKVNQEKKEKIKLQKKEVKNLINNNSFKKNEVNSQTESFQCNICVLNFTAQEHLNAHIGTCHKRTTPACTQTDDFFTISS